MGYCNGPTWRKGFFMKKFLLSIVHNGVTYCEVKEATKENMAEWIDFLADEGEIDKYIMTEGWILGMAPKGPIVFPRSVLKECVFKYREL
jgi:hypothetical protein